MPLVFKGLGYLPEELIDLLEVVGSLDRRRVVQYVPNILEMCKS